MHETWSAGYQRIRATPPQRPLDPRQLDPYAGAGRARVVMLVDDEPDIVETLARGIDILLPGVDVIKHTDPTQALADLRARDVDVIVSDHQMSPMDGVTFLSLARALQPAAARIILTGTGIPGVPVRGINEAHVSAYLTKPASLPTLVRSISDALDAA